MRPVSRGNSRHSLVGGAACQKTPIPWSALDKNPMAEPNSKAILWNKAQHEGAVPPQCLVQKNPQVPHTNRQVACHPMNNARVKRSSIPPHKTRPDSLVPTLQGPCGRSPVVLWTKRAQCLLLEWRTFPVIVLYTRWLTHMFLLIVSWTNFHSHAYGVALLFLSSYMVFCLIYYCNYLTS